MYLLIGFVMGVNVLLNGTVEIDQIQYWYSLRTRGDRIYPIVLLADMSWWLVYQRIVLYCPLLNLSYLGYSSSQHTFSTTSSFVSSSLKFSKWLKVPFSIAWYNYRLPFCRFYILCILINSSSFLLFCSLFCTNSHSFIKRELFIFDSSSYCVLEWFREEFSCKFDCSNLLLRLMMARLLAYNFFSKAGIFWWMTSSCFFSIAVLSVNFSSKCYHWCPFSLELFSLKEADANDCCRRSSFLLLSLLFISSSLESIV